MHASDPVSRYFSHNLFLLSPRGDGGRFSPDAQARGNGYEVFQAGVLTAGSGGQEEEDLSRQVFNMFFVSFCEGRTDGGISATAPPTRTSFSPMNLLTPARIQARSTQRVWVRHALMSSATDFGCKVTARKLRSKIFPPFFSKFFDLYG